MSYSIQHVPHFNPSLPATSQSYSPVDYGGHFGMPVANETSSTLRRAGPNIPPVQAVTPHPRGRLDSLTPQTTTHRSAILEEFRTNKGRTWDILVFTFINCIYLIFVS
jgi:hypothetical protein